MFSKFNLQQRLNFLVLLSCVLLIAVSALGLYAMQASHDAMLTLHESQMTPDKTQAAPVRRLQETQAAHDSRFHVVAGMMVLSILLIGVIGFLTTRRIAYVTGLVREALKRMAAGDFTGRIDYHGGLLKRIVADINATAKILQSVISEVNQVSTQLAASATELSNITETTERDIKQQQNETTQVQSAMQEMSSATHAIANNAAQAATAANDADKQAMEGAEIVTQAINVIQGMTNDMENSTSAIHQLQQESTNIGAVLHAIKEIADQTNLLALNAAIEAARAGEQGRGFAVVADEVRTLAGRTQQATVEIQGMIESLQVGSKEAVQTILKSSERVQAGVSQAARANDALSAITLVVNKITDMNTQIASAAEEQSAVVEEMNGNIASISQISSKTAQGANHTAQASSGVASMAAQLRSTLAQFKV